VQSAQKSVSVVASSLPHVFLAALEIPSATLHLLDLVAHLHSLNALCLLASLHAIASADILNIFIGLNALDGFARLDTFNVLTRLESVHSWPTFAGLQSLHSLHSLRAMGRLDALADLGSLQTRPGVHALNTSRTHASELLLQVRVVERHIGAMSRVELPVLKLTATGDVDSVEFAVKNSVGLDGAVTSISPIVAVP
jgi:hypothetical protein